MIRRGIKFISSTLRTSGPVSPALIRLLFASCLSQPAYLAEHPWPPCTCVVYCLSRVRTIACVSPVSRRVRLASPRLSSICLVSCVHCKLGARVLSETRLCPGLVRSRTRDHQPQQRWQRQLQSAETIPCTDLFGVCARTHARTHTRARAHLYVATFTV